MPDYCFRLAKRIIDLVARQCKVEGHGLLDIIAQLADQQMARELLTFVRGLLDLIYLLPHMIKRYR